MTRIRFAVLSILLLALALPAAAQFAVVMPTGAPTGTCPSNGGPVLGADKANNTVYVCSPGKPWTPFLSGTGLLTNGTGQVKLGTAGSVVGSLVFYNATSGGITVNAPTGALGTVALTLPTVSGGIPSLASVNTWTATNNFATVTNSGSTTTSDANCINLVAATGQGSVKRCSATEIIAAPVGGTTSDSTANLLPADALIVGVVGRVTTAISGGTCSSWAVGDGTTAARFIAADSTLTVNEVKASTGTAWTTGIASATTGMKQGSAAKVRVTCGTGGATAGAVEVTVFYDQSVAPTQ